ncbi:sensor histidine kinase [Actinokineospora fastidiosa]|uniref:histidine kinase n=1 Tax=Actinokineospora fastidiosa TaxID=1816 RepID=A0A918GEY9_9PSEU|nr:ATP-binding protein [Actinokineospora fastidiosa]GGS31756.1 two-component sensor histidine kinase [Actinokineospora fastidiosa]
MSSSPRVSSLRARLIAEQTVLLAMVCLVIGVTVMVALQAFLLNRLDDDLMAASARAVAQPGPPRPAPPGQETGTIDAVIVDGDRLLAQVQTPSGERRALTDLAPLHTLPADGVIRERDLGGLGTYRVVAVRIDPRTVVVTGLPLTDVHDTLWTVGLVLGGVSLIGLTVAGVAGALLVRRALTPLDRMAATARRVAELPLHEGEVALPDRVPAGDTDPRTEVGQVGAALNRMLDHVGDALAARHESETRVRQFVADASHELRTPLAAIRGYTELARRDDGLPGDVAHALARVDSESGRMTALVEDLLLLARLDSGRPLLREPVDLSALVVTAVGDAQVSGPDHRWRLDLPAEPVTATGDAARLHQVVANLLVNGSTHTPPGTTVTTALSTRGGTVTLTVTDDGPGIPADLLPTVFERFARGDTSRSRAAGSTGLGLAIVAAVVAAHGGGVSVESRPGRTRFAIRLHR